MPSWFEKHGDTVIINATIILAFAVSVIIIDQRMDARDKFLSQPLGAHDRYVVQRIHPVERPLQPVDRRFDAMDKRIDRLTDEGAELRKLLVGIDERMSRNEGRIDVILEQIQAADTPSSPD